MPQRKRSPIGPSIRKPIGSRPGEPGFVGVRAATRTEALRQRLVPASVQEGVQDLVSPQTLEVAGPGATRLKVPVPLVGGVGSQAFALNSPTFRLLKFMKTFRRAAGKRAFTEAEKKVLRKMMKQEPALERAVGKFDNRRALKFLDPTRGQKPPSNFDLPNLKNVGELKKMAKSAEFRGQMDVVRKKLRRPSVEKQLGPTIRDIEQRAAGTGKPSDLPRRGRRAKLKSRAQKIREAVKRTFGKRKKK